jgi:hypothetical protein
MGRVAAHPQNPGLTAGAAFVSQLIAEHDHLPPQRERRRATVSVALGSYQAAAAIGVRRLPPGYRRTILA